MERRPSFEKIFIGPFLVLGEMVCLGHYMESIKITRQATGMSYFNITKQFIKLDGPMFFLRGFYPYGFIQMGKGLPILFTQGEVRYFLDKNTNFGNTHKGIISGVTSGMAQAVILTPLQKLKTHSMTNIHSKGLNSTSLLKEIVNKEGFKSLFKGLQPMLLKRSLDWGIRFGVITKCEQMIIHRKGKDYKLSEFEKIAVGFIGGIFSCITMPFDSLIANCQKFNQTQISPVHVAKNMYKTDGYLAFNRGFLMRILHSGWHTAWIVGIGSIVYEKIK